MVVVLNQARIQRRLVVATYAPAVRRDGAFLLERKTLAGLMQLEAELGMSVTLIAREWDASLPNLLDPVSVNDGDVGPRIVVRRTRFRTDDAAKSVIGEALEGAAVVYGMGLDVLEAAIRRRIPIVPIVENRMLNALRITRQESGSWWHSFRGQVAIVLEYQRLRFCLAQAAVVHAVGYLSYEALVDRYPTELFLDSRVTIDNLISTKFLADRVGALRCSQPLHCVAFGRLESIKGAHLVVEAALLAIKGGAQLTLDVFGDGSLRESLDARIAAAGAEDLVVVHGAVPFPELQQRVRACDLFLAGNTQDDPSCAYLEAFGAGLPVLGFGNRYWQRLAGASAAGSVVSPATVTAMAKGITAMIDSPSTTARMALAARTFAERHTFEEEFARRASSLRSVIDAAAGARRS